MDKNQKIQRGKKNFREKKIKPETKTNFEITNIR